MKSVLYSRNIYYYVFLVYLCPPQVLDEFYSQDIALCLKIVTLLCFKDKFHIVLFLTASTVCLTDGSKIGKMDDLDVIVQSGKGIAGTVDVWRGSRLNS